MNLKKSIENHPLYFVLALVVPVISVFGAGFWTGRECLKNDVAGSKIELQNENGRLKDQLKQYENSSKGLSEKAKECEERFSELNSQMVAQKNQYDAEIKKCRKSISDLQNRTKSQLKVSAQPKTEQTHKEIARDGDKGNRQIPTNQVEGFIFEAISCTKQGRGIILELRITNNNASEGYLALNASGLTSNASLYGLISAEVDPSPTYLQNARGSKYVAKAVEFGNQSAPDQVQQKLLPGASMTARFWFENVQTDEDSKINLQLAVIHRLGLLLISGRSYLVPLQDIPVESLP